MPDEGIWPVTIAGWVALIVSVSMFLGGIIIYYRGWIIFRHSIDERFEKLDVRLNTTASEFTKSVERIVDDVIGLPRNTSVKSVVNGMGARIDQANKEDDERDKVRREKLGELVQAQRKIHDIENAITNLVGQIGEIKTTGLLTVSELRALTRDTNTRISDVARELAVIGTELKHLQQRAK